jgi:hypothetical protein
VVTEAQAKKMKPADFKPDPHRVLGPDAWDNKNPHKVPEPLERPDEPPKNKKAHK